MKIFNFFNKSTVNDLVEERIDLSTDILTKISESLQNLCSVDIPKSILKNYTLRTFNHTALWARAYIEAEVLDLSDFDSDKKSYNIYLLKSVSGRLLYIAFRLQTTGLQGFTEYRIEVAKVGDFYACRE